MTSSAATRGARVSRRTTLHVHWFRWRGEDPFGGSSLYACRCGQVRPGI